MDVFVPQGKVVGKENTSIVGGTNEGSCRFAGFGVWASNPSSPILSSRLGCDLPQYACYEYNIIAMAVTHPTNNNDRVPWLLLVFSLPTSRASQRVEVWRKLQRYGVLALRSSGYVLPNSAANQEKLEWLATAIRSYKGQASVVQVQAFDDLPEQKLTQLFMEARSKDYESLLRDLKKLVALSPTRRPAGRLSRIGRRFPEI